MIPPNVKMEIQTRSIILIITGGIMIPPNVKMEIQTRSIFIIIFIKNYNYAK